jgi:hypothetical protein
MISCAVNNSVPRSILGSANGVSYGFASLGRMCGSGSLSAAFGWSVGTPTGFPLDSSFAFMLSGTMGVMCLILLYGVLDSTVNKQLEEGRRTELEEGVLENSEDKTKLK